MSQQYFTHEYIDFFTELAFNNEKSWFDANRKRYEQHVREPFKAYTMDIIAAIQKFDSGIGPLEPKDVMFRINRDIRFSHDKTPYNTWLSAYIARGGKRSEDESAGYYFRFAVDGVSIGGGLYSPSREKLHAIRSKIASDPKAFRRVIEAKKFTKSWGEIRGEEHKVIPKEFKEAAQAEPFIRRKGFTYFQEFPEQEILRPDLLEWMSGEFKTALEFNEFLR